MREVPICLDKKDMKCQMSVVMSLLLFNGIYEQTAYNSILGPNSTPHKLPNVYEGGGIRDNTYANFFIGTPVTVISIYLGWRGLSNEL